jgi:precorrin-6A/cobalt-precorrin-6A reductase
MARQVLILGGTRDARKLAGMLVGAGDRVVTSLAGVTDKPHLPDGKVRIGGFGGAGGLADYLKANAIDLLIDATHSFAARISSNAVVAAADAGVRLIRLERPAWIPNEGDRWRIVGSVEAAASALQPGACAFVTIGRKDISQFAGCSDVRLVARMIEPPDIELPAGSRLVLARPPFALADEEALMRDEGVSVLVSKNAGGPGRAKLDAARRLGIPVIMIARPVLPPADTAESPAELAQKIGNDE